MRPRRLLSCRCAEAAWRGARWLCRCSARRLGAALAGLSIFCRDGALAGLPMFCQEAWRGACCLVDVPGRLAAALAVLSMFCRVAGAALAGFVDVLPGGLARRSLSCRCSAGRLARRSLSLSMFCQEAWRGARWLASACFVPGYVAAMPFAAASGSFTGVCSSDGLRPQRLTHSPPCRRWKISSSRSRALRAADRCSSRAAALAAKHHAPRVLRHRQMQLAHATAFAAMHHAPRVARHRQMQLAHATALAAMHHAPRVLRHRQNTAPAGYTGRRFAIEI